MHEQMLEQATLEDLKDFDLGVRKLVQAGVHLQWMPGTRSSELLIGSQAAVDYVAANSTSNLSVSSLLRDSTISESYRDAFATWLATNKSVDAYNLLADMRQEYSNSKIFRLFVTQIIVLLVLAVIVLWFWSLNGLKQLNEMYAESNVGKGPIQVALSPLVDLSARIATIEKSTGIAVLPFVIAAVILGCLLVVYVIHRFQLVQSGGATRQIWKSSQAIGLLMRSGMTFSGARDFCKGLGATSRGSELPPPVESSEPVEWARYVTSDLRLERELKSRFTWAPFAIYLVVGAVVVLVATVMVFGPTVEFLYQFSHEVSF